MSGGPAAAGRAKGNEMDRLEGTRMGVGEKVTLAAAALLLVDLVLLPWHVYAGSWYTYWDDFGSYTQTTAPSTTNGFQGSGAALGVLAGIAALSLLARIVMSRMGSEALGRVPEIWRERPVLEGTVAALVALKLLMDPSNLGYGAIVGVALAAAIVLGRYLMVQEGRTLRAVADAAPAAASDGQASPDSR
jgi:hypothetical protein